MAEQAAIASGTPRGKFPFRWMEKQKEAQVSQFHCHETRRAVLHHHERRDRAEWHWLIINNLDPEVRQNLILGLTDTPSANRKAWVLLEERFPGTVWCRCMAHEISLLFKDFKKHVPELKEMLDAALGLVKWVNNHDEILEIFRTMAAVVFQGHAREAQKAGIGLFNPPDTRMALLYVMLHRVDEVKGVLEAMVHFQGNGKLPSYDVAAQKAMVSYNKTCQDPEKHYQPKPSQSALLIDPYKDTIKNKDFWDRSTEFLQIAKTPMWLLRMVDSNLPSLSKVPNLSLALNPRNDPIVHVLSGLLLLLPR